MNPDIIVFSLIMTFALVVLLGVAYSYITSINKRQALILLVQTGACISVNSIHLFKGKYGKKYIIYRFDANGDAIPEHDEYYMSSKQAVDRFLVLLGEENHEDNSRNSQRYCQINHWH